MYDAYPVKNHDHAEIARACVREYVEQNAQLIRSWLEGSGKLEDVGAELVLSEVERYNLHSKPGLRGLAGPSIDKIFREAPGGQIAARRYLAECNDHSSYLQDTGNQSAFVSLHRIAGEAN